MAERDEAARLWMRPVGDTAATTRNASLFDGLPDWASSYLPLFHGSTSVGSRSGTLSGEVQQFWLPNPPSCRGTPAPQYCDLQLYNGVRPCIRVLHAGAAGRCPRHVHLCRSCSDTAPTKALLGIPIVPEIMLGVIVQCFVCLPVSASVPVPLQVVVVVSSSDNVQVNSATPQPTPLTLGPGDLITFDDQGDCRCAVAPSAVRLAS